MTGSTQRRDEQVGTFFAAHTDRLRHRVRRRVNHVGDELIEDACQMARATLLQRPDITPDARGLGWLTTVAVHEARATLLDRPRAARRRPHQPRRWHGRAG